MKIQSEDYLQNEIYTWYNNNHCLKHHTNRGIIFAIPNGGYRNSREAAKLVKTGLLKGASDIIVIFPNGKLYFIELKTITGTQQPQQKEFSERIELLGFNYKIIRSLKEFQNLTELNISNDK